MNEKHYKLRFLPLFEEDLNEIVDYITNRLKNPIAADALVSDVQTAIRNRLSCAESFTVGAISSTRSESLVQDTIHRTLHHSNLIILSQIVGGRLLAAVWLFFVVGRFGDV